MILSTLLKKAYRIIYRKGYSLKDAIKQLHTLNKDPNLALKTFISSIERSKKEAYFDRW